MGASLGVDSLLDGQQCCGRGQLQDKHTYSVWLIPERGAVQERLDSLVKQTSWEYNGPSFDFHVTLLGGIQRSELGPLKDEMEKLAKQIKAFDIVFPPKSLTCYDTWNQNVVVMAEPSAALMAANLLTLQALKDKDAEVPCFGDPCKGPHASLLYGEQSQEVRERAVTWVRKQAPWVDAEWSFEVKGLALYETDGGPQRYVDGVPLWRCVGTVSFGSSMADAKKNGTA